MRTFVSVPDEVLERAEALAKHLKLNRSQLFTRALSEFVARHSPEEITDALDAIVAELEEEPAAFTQAAARRTLRRGPR